jgi:hypothetical protein
MRRQATSGRGSSRSDISVVGCTAMTGSTASSACLIVRARLASCPSFSTSPWVTRFSSDLARNSPKPGCRDEGLVRRDLDIAELRWAKAGMAYVVGVGCLRVAS